MGDSGSIEHVDDLIIMGRLLGTYDGWDSSDEDMIFYNFKPTDNVAVIMHGSPAKTLCIMVALGKFIWYDDITGAPIKYLDVLSVLKELPIVKEYADNWRPAGWIRP